jgi:hypothetical protein
LARISQEVTERFYNLLAVGEAASMSESGDVSRRLQAGSVPDASNPCIRA